MEFFVLQYFAQILLQKLFIQHQDWKIIRLKLGGIFKKIEHKSQKIEKNLNMNQLRYNEQKQSYYNKLLKTQKKQQVSILEMNKFNFYGRSKLQKLILLLVIKSLVWCRYQYCITSEDIHQRICYYKQSFNKYQFISCQESICEPQPDGSSCLQNVYHYNQSQCVQHLCKQNPDQVSIAKCIQKFRNQMEIIMSFITAICLSIFIIVCLIFGLIIYVYCDLKIKLCIESYNRRKSQNPSSNDPIISGTILREENNGLNEGIQQPPNKSKTKKSIKFTEHTFNNQYQISYQKFKTFLIEEDLNIGFASSHLEEQTCCICLSSKVLNCQTSCHHFYHSKCIIEWMKRQDFCPCCRRKEFLPIKIFCVTCGKVRDIFRLKGEAYIGYSRFEIDFFNLLLECKQCRIIKN